jgi:hypothetical protein
MRGLKASVDEIVAGPVLPIIERAAKDFDNPGMKDPQRLADLVQSVIEQFWLGEGKQNLLRNMPTRYKAGADALRDVGIADIKDPDSFYTNQFLD